MSPFCCDHTHCDRVVGVGSQSFALVLQLNATVDDLNGMSLAIEHPT